MLIAAVQLYFCMPDAYGFYHALNVPPFCCGSPRYVLLKKPYGIQRMLDIPHYLCLLNLLVFIDSSATLMEINCCPFPCPLP